jgi:PAS domain S-box-containing protein
LREYTWTTRHSRYGLTGLREKGVPRRPRKSKFRSGDAVFKKLISNSEALKDLVALVVASILFVAFPIFFRGLDYIEEWERKNRLSGLHIAEIAMVLIILLIAAAIFFIRRYQELQEGVLEDQTIPQKKNMKTLFCQIETAKKEWERSLDSIEDMVILSDLDGTIHRCNRAFKDFIGRPYEEIRGKDFASLLSNYGLEVKDLDLNDLNARLNIMGKWFIVKSFPYNDSETGIANRTVIIMHTGSTNNGSAKVRFVWGRAGHPVADDSHTIR